MHHFGHNQGPQQTPGTLLTTLTGHTEKINTVAWSPDGRSLASGGLDSKLRIWNPPNPQPVTTLPVEEDSEDDEGPAVWNAAWSPDGRLLAFSAGSSGSIGLWDAYQNTRLKSFTQPDDADAMSVAWSPDSRFLASGDDEGTICLWDVSAGTKLTTLKGHSDDFVWSVAWSPDGSRIASACDDKTVRLWDARSGQTIAVLPLQPFSPQSVAWSRDGRFLAVGGAREPRIWDTATGQPVVHQWHGAHSDHATTGVAWSPDGRLLAAGSRDPHQPLSLWDVFGARPFASLNGHTKYVSAVSWSPDGRLLASASEDLTVRIWLVG